MAQPARLNSPPIVSFVMRRRPNQAAPVRARPAGTVMPCMYARSMLNCGSASVYGERADLPGESDAGPAGAGVTVRPKRAA